MDQMADTRLCDEGPLKRIAEAIAHGVVVVDADGHVVGATGGALERLNGGLSDAQAASDDTAITCTLRLVDAGADGARTTICLIKETKSPDSGRDLISAVEAIMSDTSWLARALIDKVNAWRQSHGTVAKLSDLEKLTAREREILAMICEGRSDAEMGRLLGLSQNTVRNHVASLYRKIGVNRRGAAIIWARERAVTVQDVMMLKPPRRSRNGNEGQNASR